MQAAGPIGWGLLFLAIGVLGLAPAAWLLQARVARAVGARPAYGAALWTVLFAGVLWAMLAVAALIAAQASGLGSGAPFAALAAALSWLALGVGVRLYLPDPTDAKLAWRRALSAALPAVALLWAETLLVRWALEWGGIG